MAAYQACHFLGMPECNVTSDAGRGLPVRWPRNPTPWTWPTTTAKKDAVNQLAEPVPLVIRNAPTRLMKELDYGKGYQYAHDA